MQNSFIPSYVSETLQNVHILFFINSNNEIQLGMSVYLSIVNPSSKLSMQQFCFHRQVVSWAFLSFFFFHDHRYTLLLTPLTGTLELSHSRGRAGW